MTNDLQDKVHDQMSRRTFLTSSGIGLGAAALSAILPSTAQANDSFHKIGPHFAPKVKRVIYLHQSGAPSQLETFDYKPKLEAITMIVI